MLFNSLEFMVFLPMVFVLYWLLQRRALAYQNALLIAASYFFYGWWDYRFLTLIIISSATDFIVGLKLEGEERELRRKWLLATSVAVNVGILGFFKYFDFFVKSFADVLNSVGLQANLPALNIILPVGISFYTFQTMSYTLDIYRREFSATRNPISFFAFVSFFPQLVAGPIERARNLLPQFEQPRKFDTDAATDGLRQSLWGMFKKVVIADNLAEHVDAVYGSYPSYDGVTLILATFFFAIQIYCDFSGYSDIAIGTARLFGIRLRRNFAFPYFSRDIGEFWRRWHISLSTWFRDYVFIPLGGSRVSNARRLFNIVVTFTVSGLWHGANWTFVLWGLLHGLYYTPLMMTNLKKDRPAIVASGRLLPGLADTGRMTATFLLVLLSWVFFRAQSLPDALGYLSRIATTQFIDPGFWHAQYYVPLLYGVGLLAIEWLQRDKHHALSVEHLPRVVRWIIYVTVALGLLILGNMGEVDFIYFQF